MDFIDFLNDYNGFVISVLTLVLVIATVWYAWVTKKILKINEQTHIQTTRPYVLATFEAVDDGLEFQIKNYGKTAAYKTKIKIDPPLDSIDMILNEKFKKRFYQGHKPMLTQEFLPPGFEVKTVLQLGQEYVSNDELNREFKFFIEYKNYEGQKFISDYNVDISRILFKEKIKFFTDGYYLNEINKSIKKLIEIQAKK